jgi:hypothetical protein
MPIAAIPKDFQAADEHPEVDPPDPELTGISNSVGLSNFTTMLPAKKRMARRSKGRWRARF